MMSSAVAHAQLQQQQQQRKTRRRKGSLRKTALLGTRLEYRNLKRGAAPNILGDGHGPHSQPPMQQQEQGQEHLERDAASHRGPAVSNEQSRTLMDANIDATAASSPSAPTQPQHDSSSSTSLSPYLSGPRRQRAANALSQETITSDGDTTEPSFHHNNASDNDNNLANPITSTSAHTAATATATDTRNSSPSNNNNDDPSSTTDANNDYYNISPPASTTSESYFRLQPDSLGPSARQLQLQLQQHQHQHQHQRRTSAHHRTPKSSFGVTASAHNHHLFHHHHHHHHPINITANDPSNIDAWDYSETEWWGWIILIVTWLGFVIGMGSCFGVWSWAWDVGETPYAPPELEDDPTLPIVGYYPALIILTAVMAWVWVVIAWVGMKYFKHANISGDE